MKIIIGNKCIYNSDFDNKLTFNSHVTKLCKKAGQKLHALSRISSFMSIKQKKNIMNTFIFSHFSYCPLIWICHSRSLKSQIYRIHERALRIVYSDNFSSFDELLKMSNSVRVHHRNIQLLAVEIYKALNKLSSSLMTELFQIKKTKYDLCKGNILISRNVKTVYYGTESISYLAPKIWELIPTDIKNCKSLNCFKSKIKLWVPYDCPCRICKIYIQNLTFI